MEINKWYYNSKHDILELIFILDVTDKSYRVLSIQNRFKKITEYPDFVVDRNYTECNHVDIKGGRYSVFDESYHYLGEVNL